MAAIDFPNSPTVGQAFTPANGVTYVWNGTLWLASGASGTLIQTVSYQTGAVATGTTVIPSDDTIPQIGEGTEFMTLAITPKSATSKLIIDVVAQLTHNTASAGLTAALFQDSTANALAAGRFDQTSSGFMTQVKFTHIMVSGTTSSTTFRIRGGAQNAGTMTFNGGAGVRMYGGVMASSIVIQEVAP